MQKNGWQAVAFGFMGLSALLGAAAWNTSRSLAVAYAEIEATHHGKRETPQAPASTSGRRRYGSKVENIDSPDDAPEISYGPNAFNDSPLPSVLPEIAPAASIGIRPGDKCIDHTLFRKENGEWRNLSGPC